MLSSPGTDLSPAALAALMIWRAISVLVQPRCSRSWRSQAASSLGIMPSFMSLDVSILAGRRSAEFPFPLAESHYLPSGCSAEIKLRPVWFVVSFPEFASGFYCGPELAGAALFEVSLASCRRFVNLGPRPVVRGKSAEFVSVFSGGPVPPGARHE